MTSPFAGLSAFPLTPLPGDRLDEPAFARLVRRVAGSGVDSITALGSTGSYAYLTAKERARVARLAVENADGTPVLVGIGALRTSHVLRHADDAAAAGAAGLLLAPVSYQPLTDDDVLELFRTVTERSGLPVVVYDNPGTTHFRFSTELYGRIAELPGIASIKIPPLPADPAEARARVEQIRAVIPEYVTLGISGDASAAAGLASGCDAWYSVLAGTLPEPALRIMRAAQQGRAQQDRPRDGQAEDGGAEDAAAESERLAPLWRLFAEFGSLRVIAAIAEELGLVPHRSLPLPLQGLTEVQRTRVADTLDVLGLNG
ncbi:dihydrodipicolinate synthase family protein [Zhihengliuella sp.]|uniref:dihydrodipicolinate synthase family protein n=1 Tax=Zhihengliuella sp. TaxID=1954483 RepID=UPI002810D0A7|nr:dihydrodipicolinate synthase family protein [Zhihengliuella sp.]